MLIREAAGIEQLHQDNPFEAIPLTKDIRWYVSFLREPPTVDLDIPWTSEDKSFQILDIRDQGYYQCAGPLHHQNPQSHGSPGENVWQRHHNPQLENNRADCEEVIDSSQANMYDDHYEPTHVFFSLRSVYMLFPPSPHNWNGTRCTGN